MVGFVISDIIGSVDGKVSCVYVVALDGSLEQFWVMDSTVLFEV
jgi:hypothetical protein